METRQQILKNLSPFLKSKVKPKLNVTNVKSPFGGSGSIPKMSAGGGLLGLKSKSGIKSISGIKNTPANLVDTVKSNISTIDSIITVENRVGVNEKKITLLKNIIHSLTQSVRKNADAARQLSTSFAKYIIGDTKLKQKEDKDANREDKLQQEEEKSDKKEGLLEGVKKSVGNALLKPVQNVGKNVKSILSKLVNVLGLLFGGWLTDKGLKMLQAWQSGDKETFKEMRNKIIGSLAVVGGILLAFQVGLSALPGLLITLGGSIISIGGAILGFLISPPGLIALAIAAGVGGMVVGAKALGTKLAGGKGFADAEEKLINMKNKLSSEMTYVTQGPNKGWNIYKNGVGYSVSTHGTEEQKAALKEYQDEEQRIERLKKSMDKEIEEYKKGWKKEAMASKVEGKKVDWAYWNPIRDENISKIKEKYNRLALNMNGKPLDGSSVTPSNTSKATTTPKLPVLEDTEPKVIIKKSSKAGGSEKVSLHKGSSTDVPYIASSNNDDFAKLYSQIHYNVVV